MCSYQRINNSYGCANSKSMNGILKTELGFQVRKPRSPSLSIEFNFSRALLSPIGAPSMPAPRLLSLAWT